jgi:hypothetical protein
LIEAWALLKSFKTKDGSGAPPGPGRNAEHDFHGETRPNQTHAPTPDTAAKLYRKSLGAAARLCFVGHLLMENRHGLVVDARLGEANGTAERDTEVAMVGDRRGAIRSCVAPTKPMTGPLCRLIGGLKVTPHVAQNMTRRKSAIDCRIIWHPATRSASGASRSRSRSAGSSPSAAPDPVLRCRPRRPWPPILSSDGQTDRSRGMIMSSSRPRQ